MRKSPAGKLRESHRLRVVGHRLAVVAYLPERDAQANPSIDPGRVLSERLSPLGVILINKTLASHHAVFGTSQSSIIIVLNGKRINRLDPAGFY